MLSYIWTTDGRGVVFITDPNAPGSEPYAPQLAGQQRQLLFGVAQQWRPLVERHAGRVRVHPAWLLGMAYRESGGNPDAVNPEGPGPEDDGLGIFQITYPGFKKGYTRAQLLDPEVNTRIAADVVGQIVNGGHGFPVDLPTAASIYNAGGLAHGVAHASADSPWGMRETRGHILAVVSGSNTAILALDIGVPAHDAADELVTPA